MLATRLQPHTRPCTRPCSSRPALACRAIKLYTNPGSRGKITEWYLGELGLEYTPVLLDMRKGEHKAPEFLAINPFGKVPTLTDGDLKLFESGAILLHLANKYGKLTQDQLSIATQWTMFANSTMCEAFFYERNRTGPLLSQLEGILSDKAYLAGPEFSVSDIAVSSYLLYLPVFFPTSDLTPYPAVLDYMARCAARPACPDSYKEALAAYLSKVKPAGGSSSGSGGQLGDLLQKLGMKR